jgi:hypothetical protein
MYCQHCGQRLVESAQFCGGCGRGVAGAAAARGGWEHAQHVKLLGILWLLSGSINLISAVLVFFLSRIPLIVDLPFLRSHFLSGLLWGAGVLMGLAALGGIAAGYGLLERESWARPLAIVMAVLKALKFPLGTALALYTFWVLLPARHEAAYRSMQRA